MAVNTQLGLLDAGRQEPSSSSPPKKFAITGDAALSSGLSFLSSLYNAWQTDKTNKENRAFAESQATTAYERQKELMQMEWDYMSPSAQMLRYAAAGLNPNLVYSQLSPPGSAPSAPIGNATPLSAPQIGDLGSSILSARLADAQIERLQTQNTNDTDKIKQDIEESLSRIGLNKENATYISQLATTVPSQIAKLEQEVALLSRQDRSLAWDNALKSATFTDNVKSVSSNAKISETQAKYVNEYWIASLLNLNMDAKVKLSQAHLNYKQASMVTELADLYRWQTAGTKADYDLMYNDNIKYKGKKMSYARLQALTNATLGATEMDQAQTSLQFSQKTSQLLNRYGDVGNILGLVLDASHAFQSVTGGVRTIGKTRYLFH